MTSPAGEVAIYPSRLRLLILASLALAASGLAAWMAISDVAGASSTRWFRSYGKVVGGVGLSFFGLAAVWSLDRLVVRRPALVISREGLVDRSSAIGIGMIRWEEVRELRILAWPQRGFHLANRFLGIVPRDVEGLKRIPRRARLAARFDLRMGLPPVLISQLVLPMKLEDLIAVVRRFNSDVPVAWPEKRLEPRVDEERR